MSSIRPRNNMHILALVGGVAIIGLFMPLFMGGGNVPTGDALNLIENAFQIVSNSTTNEFNATADEENDILQLIAGDGMIITVDSANDRFFFNSTGGGGGSGETNLGANVGGATGTIFRDKTGVTLNFKTVSTAGDGIVITNNADTVGLSLNNIPKSEISLSGTWVTADLPATVVYTTDNVGVLADVVDGCGDGQILKYQTSNTTWICAVDAGAGSGEVNTASNVGSGVGVFDQKSVEDLEFNSLIGGDGVNVTDTVQDLTIDVDSTVLRTTSSIHQLGNVTSTGCANNEILEVSGTNWVCGSKSGGISITSINADTTSAQVFSGTTDQVVITDTGAGTLSWDVGTDVVQIDQANTYEDANVQTFSDDDFQISNPAGTFQYIFSTGAIGADRLVSLPALGSNDVFVFQSATQTLTGKSIDADTNTITNIEDSHIKLGANIAWSKISKTGSLISDIGDTTDGCADGEILLYQTSNTTWICSLAGAVNADIIFEGDSSVEVIDPGVGGQVDIDIDGSNEAIFDDTGLTLSSGNGIFMSDNSDIQWAGEPDRKIKNTNGGFEFEVETGDKFEFTIQDGAEYLFSATKFTIGDNKIVGSMGCADTEILKYQLSNTTWICAVGIGTHDILSASHSDSTAGNVTRGSLIYGDATPTWNELVVGGSGTILKADGTDVSWGTGTIGTEVTGASTSLTDTGDIVYLNTPNGYIDGNLQTFTDDDIEISNPAGTFQYIFSTGAISADRIVSLPVLGTNDVFVFQSASQTLTNKSIDADTNTITNIENADIKLGANIAWSKLDTTGSLLTDMGDVVSGCADGEVLEYQTSNSTWICGISGGQAENNTASNVGTGVGVFDQKNGVDLEFNSLIGGDGVNVTDTSQDITITVDDTVLRTNSTFSADANSQVFTCGAGMSQVIDTPNKRTQDGSNMDYVVCEFDTTTTETIIWTTVLPDSFNATGTIDVIINVVVGTGGDTGSTCFDISFLGLADGNVVDSAFGAVTGACTTVVVGSLEIIPMSAISTHGLNAGETAYIKLVRDVAADSNTGDVGVISIEVVWT